MRDFLTQYATAAVETWQLDTFRTDWNIGPLSNWRVTDSARCPLPPTVTGRTCPNFTLAPGFDLPPSPVGLSSELCAFEVVAPVGEMPARCAAACCGRADCTAFLSSSNGSPVGLPDRCWSRTPVCPGQSECAAGGNTSGCCFLRGGVVTYSNRTPGGNLPPGLVAGSATGRRAGTAAPLNPHPTWSSCDGLTEARYVTGLYRLWDDIRRAQPHVVIDSKSTHAAAP